MLQLRELARLKYHSQAAVEAAENVTEKNLGKRRYERMEISFVRKTPFFQLQIPSLKYGGDRVRVVRAVLPQLGAAT